MSIISITPYYVGQVGQGILRWKLICTDTLAQVTAAGFLNGGNLMGYTMSPNAIVDCVYLYTGSVNQPGSGTYVELIPSISYTAGFSVITLNEVSQSGVPVSVAGDFVTFSNTSGGLADSGISPSDATKTKAAMVGSSVVIGYIAHFVDTAGTIDDTAGAVTNPGGIYAGLDAVAGVLRSYPATTATGYLGLTGVSNGGAFNVQISNASHGQSTVYSIADIGAATGGLVAATTAIKMKVIAGASAAGGAAAQSFTDAFSTTGSNIVGNWNTQTNAASVLKIVPGNGSFVVTSSADAGSGTFNYIITK